ncbi:MAG: beta-glucosidase [Fimbriimonadaceae bacterium]|nr:beta-glucosidase [Fimbriimonadaceae bacterium]
MDAQTPPYKNPKLDVAARVLDLLQRMTTSENIAQLRSDSNPEVYEQPLKTTGFGFYPVYPLRGLKPEALAQRMNELQRMAQSSRLGIPIMPYEEALHGLIDNGHTSFPQAIGLAATWDPDFVHQVAKAIAEETRAQGIRQVLSPVINVCRDARWGRVEETYGEDTLLTSKMGVAFVSAFEKAGIVTTPKHYIANVGDGGRDSYSVHISERQLFEIYMPPFLACIRDGGSRSIMCSYNALNGIPTASDPWLLTDVLRKQLGFTGYVVSDWGAAGNVYGRFHQADTEEKGAALLLNAGMDAEHPGVYMFGKPLEDAVKNGLVSMKTLDESVARILRVKFEIGLFDDAFVDPAVAATTANSQPHRELALEAARRAMVLLKNENDVLPLAKKGRIAVFGDLANGTVPLGGYSGNPGSQISILEGLERHAPNVEFDFLPGCSVNPNSPLPTIPAEAFGSGLKAEFWANQNFEGAPALTRTDRNIDFDWIDDAPAAEVPKDHFSAVWTGTLTAPETGEYDISVTSDDGVRVYVDDKLLAENWSDHAASTVTGKVTMKAGVPVPIRVEYYEGGGQASIKLGWQIATDEFTFQFNILEAAKAADASVVFVGIREGEGQDRAFLDLPGNQERVIAAAADAGKPVIVVLVAGAPVTMEKWIDRVPAILDAWYPGQEGPAAIAETLFGDNNPGGKLPITFPKTVGQCPLYYNYEPSGRGYGYVDSTGDPLFPFGHGLSYTTFRYSELKVGGSEVSVTLENMGDRPGAEVAQLYVHQQISPVVRPLKELHAFQRVFLQPGERKEVKFAIGEHLYPLGPDLRRTSTPATFDVMVGSSSNDIRERGVLTIPKA